MYRKLSSSFILVFLIIVIASCKTTGNSKNPATINLFNGKDLDGWYTYIQHRGKDTDPKKVFTVEDGLIRVSGEEWGCITTKKEFSNYKLVVEFKWGNQTFSPRVDNARDNGILIHSVGPDGAHDSTWMNSIECQIIEGGTGDLLVVGNETPEFSLTSPVAKEKQGDSYVFQPNGSLVTINGGRINWFNRDVNWKDVKGFRGSGDVEKPLGEWNRIECIADGDKISVMLNGVLVNQAQDVKPNKGKIQIQSEGAEIFFRRVELTPLAKSR
jgi:hypothetical protein